MTRPYVPLKTWSHCSPDHTETSWAEYQKIDDRKEETCQIDRIALQDVARERFADLLRDTWPAPFASNPKNNNDKETARRAAAALGVSHKTVLNWLACTHSAPFDVVFCIGCFTGVYRVMDVMTRGQGRTTVLNLFVRGVRRVVGR